MMKYVKCLLVVAATLIGSARQVASDGNDVTLSYLEICAVMPRRSVILRPGSCTNWIKCPQNSDLTDYEEGSCLYGLYFNKDASKCEPAASISCPYDESSQADGQMSRCNSNNNGTFLEDFDSCNGYIYCSNGIELRSKCPGELVFNPLTSRCVYKSDYECKPPVDQSPNQTHPICLSVRDEQLFADEKRCDTYHECREGQLLTMTCDAGEGFDHRLGHCVPQTDVECMPNAAEPEPEVTVCGDADSPKVGYFSDGVSCSGYYICKKVADGYDREPMFAKCPVGYFFDSAVLSCRDRLNVKCELDRCDGMGNKYVNIAGDCSAYARCQNNVAVSTGNCPDKYYFDEKTQGCTPQNIQYAACS